MSTIRTATYCAECGTRLGEGRFCPGCGIPLPGVTNGETVTQTLPAAEPFPRFNGHNGGYADLGPGYPAQGGGRRWLWIALAGGAVVVVAVAVSLLSGVFSSSGKSYSSKLAVALTPVVNQNRLLSNSLAGLPGSKLQAITNVITAQQQSTLARGQFAALGNGDPTLAREARSALDAEDAYLAAVKATLANPQAPGASQLEGLEGTLKNSLDALTPPLTDAGSSVTGAQQLAAWASRTVKAQGRKHSLRGFASSVDSILQRSAPSKTEISQLFTQMQNGDITVNEAQAGLGDVIANRSGLAAAARAVDAPTSQADKVKQALAAAFDASLADDRAIQNCLTQGLDTGIAILFQDCLSSTGAQSAQATSAKQQFNSLYNSLRSKLGMPASNVAF